VYSQDFRIARKLLDDGIRVEQEYIVEVSGNINEGGLALLNHGLSYNGTEIAPMKVSWQNETRLRFALKGVQTRPVEQHVPRSGPQACEHQTHPRRPHPDGQPACGAVALPARIRALLTHITAPSLHSY
jgi:hypothetical protein